MITDSFRRAQPRTATLLVGWILVVLVVGSAGGLALSGQSKAAAAFVAFTVGFIALLAIFARHVHLLFAFTFAARPFSALRVPGLNLPVCEVLLAVSFLLALLNSRQREFKTPTWVNVTVLVFLGFWFVSLFTNGGFGLDPLKRVSHIALFCGLIVALCSGLISRRVAQRGLLIGLIINCVVGLGMHLLNRDRYEGRMGGYLGEPNSFGFYLLVLGAVALEGEPPGTRRKCFLALFGVSVVLTLSRGTLLALIICLGWILVRRRLGPTVGLIALGTAALVILFLPTSFQTFGPFGARTGSDTLREAVLNESIPLAKQGFVHGIGPGRAVVNVYDRFRFFFHNSFLALVAEAGIGAMISYMVLLAGTFNRLIRLSDRLSNPWFEAALLTGFFCALHLGEVLVELPMAVAIGCALNYVLSVTNRGRDRTPAMRAA